MEHQLCMMQSSVLIFSISRLKGLLEHPLTSVLLPFLPTVNRDWGCWILHLPHSGKAASSICMSRLYHFYFFFPDRSETRVLISPINFLLIIFWSQEKGYQGMCFCWLKKRFLICSSRMLTAELTWSLILLSLVLAFFFHCCFGSHPFCFSVKFFFLKKFECYCMILWTEGGKVKVWMLMWYSIV